MSMRLLRLAAAGAVAAASACADRPTGPTPPPPALARSGGAQIASGGGGCSGPTVTEQLSGPAIGGVVPEGRAQANESQFPCGGSTILTVQVKKVNLPDGTVLGVTLDFSPIGTITLSRGEGTMTANLGHFAVSNDEVRVNDGGTTILIGPFFR